MQNPRAGSDPAVRSRRTRARLGAAAATATAWIVSSMLLAGPALAASNDSTNVAGSQQADKWPLIKTLGIFAGIPLASAVLIVFLVLLGPILRSGRAGATEDAVFAGPHAGPVETGPDREPKTHTGEPDGPAERPAGVAGSADPEPTVSGPAPAQGGAGASW